MFSFHSIIQSSYLEGPEWLLQQKDLSDYRQNNAWNKVKKKLKDPTLEVLLFSTMYYFLPTVPKLHLH